MTKTYTLVYDDVPKSNNAGGGGARANHFAAHREKKRWEGIYGILLMSERVPRGGTHASVSIELRFRDKRRRDSSNYYQSVVKPLADVLVQMGMIPDDTDEFFEVKDLTIHPDRLPKPAPPARITVTLNLTAAGVPSTDAPC